ncbi:peptidoglycan DD-metalloendopeptidase family protein [Chromobacterium vaccinii]|uniref:peptidoglycan DD-metalloendopeptidase family protein n=1 Tax=Chromobacterium vaccinii TaxID=1108595 RepID=UPI003C75C7CB
MAAGKNRPGRPEDQARSGEIRSIVEWAQLKLQKRNTCAVRQSSKTQTSTIRQKNMLKMHCRYAYILVATIGAALAGCSSIAQQPAPVESAVSAPVTAAKPAQPAAAPDNTVAAPYRDQGSLNMQPVDKAAAVADGSGSYVVKPGDNLFRVSLNHGLKYKDVAAWNNLPDTNIKVGQVLRLTPPGSSAPAASSTAARPAPEATAADHAAAQAGGATTVKAYPKALKLPYGGDAVKDLAAQSEGRAGDKHNAQASTPASAPLPGKKPEASAASPSPAADASAPTAQEDAVAWLWPTEGKLSKGYSENNKGIEISGRLGQPVLAAGDGKVVYSGAGLRGYGKLIIIKHNKTFLSAYAHNSQLLVKEGQSVKKGQKIAEMGNSDADQVKLHFEIRRFGKPVDPMQYLEHKS